jgi:hypothetical protein
MSLRDLLQRPKVLGLLIAVLAALGGGSVALVIDSDGDGTYDRTVSIAKPQRLDLPSLPPVVVDANQQVSRAEQAAEDHRGDLGVHEDARDETPPGVTADERDHLLDEQRDVAKGLDPQPVGGAQSVTCRRHPVVNQSALSAPRVGVALHITVSPEGTRNAIWGLFNTPAFAASSNYVFELRGSDPCWQLVPENRKAWTQGTFNSAYVSIEIVSNLKTRAEWLASPNFANGQLAALVRDISKRVGNPLKLVDPEGCTPLAGITDHLRLECGNDHVDVGTGFPWDVFIKQVRLGVHVSPLTKAEQRIRHRACHPAGTGHTAHYWRHRARSQVRRLDAANRRGASWHKHHRGERRRLLARAAAGKCG